jgi:fatty-acyl-CoA synthase
MEIPMQENWATLWESVADALPEHTALVQGSVRRSWAQLDDRASRLAAALTDLGAGADSKIAILAYNCPEYLEATYAAFKIRGTPVNLNLRYTDTELADVLADSDSVVLFFHGAFSALVDRVRGRLPLLRAIVQIDDGSAPLDGATRFEDLVAGFEPQARTARSGDDVFLLYTGGTTGRPRGVMWRHADIIGTLTFPSYRLAGLAPPSDAAGAAQCALRLRAEGRTPVLLAAPPLIHGTAFFLAQAALLLGGAVVLLSGRSFAADELWQTVQRERVTEIAIVGDAFARPMLEELARAEEKGEPYDITSVARISSSGVAWSDEGKQGLADRGRMMLVDMVGASEGGPLAVSIVPPGGRADQCAFRLGERAVLLREDGSLIEPGTGEIGMLGMVPPNPIGYYKDPARTAHAVRTFGDRTYTLTGDLARLEDDGRVRFLGRGALCINTGGEKVYPEEVEQVLCGHPAVLDCNVVGVPDERWQERVAAVVALADGAEVTPAELQDTVRARLAGFKVPRDIVFVAAIERTSAGKARYAWAREVVTAAPAAHAGVPERG